MAISLWVISRIDRSATLRVRSRGVDWHLVSAFLRWLRACYRVSDLVIRLGCNAIPPPACCTQYTIVAMRPMRFYAVSTLSGI